MAEKVNEAEFSSDESKSYTSEDTDKALLVEPMTITTYPELHPYIHALAAILEAVYELGKRKGMEHEELVALIRSSVDNNQ